MHILTNEFLIQLIMQRRLIILHHSYLRSIKLNLKKTSTNCETNESAKSTKSDKKRGVYMGIKRNATELPETRNSSATSTNISKPVIVINPINLPSKNSRVLMK